MLYLHSFCPDLAGLMRFAARERLLPPGDDPGYAIHAAFAAAFGDRAPKPWALLRPGQGGGPAGRLLAYAPTPLDELREHAATFADPAFTAPLALDRAATRVMPTVFPRGTHLGFRVRVRPVARTGKPLDGHPSATARGDRSRERDVYLACVDASERSYHCRAMTPGSDAGTARGAWTAWPPPSRATCYLEWLDRRLHDSGAAIARTSVRDAEDGAFAARVDAFRFTRLLARDRGGVRSRTQHPEGPDATITGTLVVTDPDRFATGIARGVGRSRAFGFGMLLLAPPHC